MIGKGVLGFWCDWFSLFRGLIELGVDVGLWGELFVFVFYRWKVVEKGRTLVLAFSGPFIISDGMFGARFDLLGAWWGAWFVLG